MAILEEKSASFLLVRLLSMRLSVGFSSSRRQSEKINKH